MLHRHGLGVTLLTVFLFPAPANCQHSAAGSMGAGSRPSPVSPTATTTNGTSLPADLGIRGIFLAGKVQMEDGGAPPEPVLIERVCGASYRKAEGYTDSKGQFSLQLGQEQALATDASFDTVTNTPGAGNGSAGNSPNRSNSSGAGSQMTGSGGAGARRDLMGCELTAALPGFRSNSVNLDEHRRLDNPNVGTFILHRLANVEGSSVSVTTLEAPKDARKAYDKAREALRKDKGDEAQKQFSKAVELCPKFAEAWYQLGILQEKNADIPEARKSYSQAMAADPKLVSPYLPLARLALHDKNWDELAGTTNRLLKLDAVDFPEAYYLNALANFRLKKPDDAESSARQALKLDSAHRFPQASHILGLLLYQKRDYAGAAEQLRNYLQLAPNAPDASQVKGQLAEIDRLATASKPGSDAPQPQ